MNHLTYFPVLKKLDKSRQKSLTNRSFIRKSNKNEIFHNDSSGRTELIDQVMWKSFDKRLVDFLLNEASIEGRNLLKITHEGIGNHWGNPRKAIELIGEKALSLIAEG